MNKKNIGILAIIVLVVVASYFVLIGTIQNPQLICGGTCRCMEKCNERGPTFFIPVPAEGYEECAVNSVNKTCCCSGV